MNKKRFALVSALVFSLPQVVSAFDKGDIIVRGGIANVSPDDSSTNLNVGGDLGYGVGVEDDTQLGLNIAYFFTDKFNVEALASTPFKHQVNFARNNPLGTGNQLGDIKHLPPTVTINYYPNNSSSAFQPYFGVGLNYTVIFDEEFTDANKNIGLADLSLDNSFGLAAQVGVDYMLNDKFFINGSARWIDIDSEASFRLNNTAGTVGDIEIDPWVFTLSLGYRF